MSRDARCGILALMGSGETAASMAPVHRALLGRLGDGYPEAVLLETPYGFQENADDVTAQAVAYFDRSVGLTVSVAPGLRGDDPPAEAPPIAAADWVFAGPGSPSYALRAWREGPVGAALRDRLRLDGGVTVLGSAAAATAGRLAVPIYEIYTVGQAPSWLDGLDLLGAVGLDVAVIPHFDNASDGDHDTRFAFLGERRLAALERLLPADVSLFGIDERTAAVIDLAAGTLQVTGRGGVTLRRAGRATTLPAGWMVTLDDLRVLLQELPENGAPPSAAPPPGVGSPGPRTLADTAALCRRRFDDADRSGDAPAMVRAILDLETAIRDWSGEPVDGPGTTGRADGPVADGPLDDGTDEARPVLRNLVVRLGEMAAVGLRDPVEELRPVVDGLLALRASLRDRRVYDVADAIGDCLLTIGLRVHDTDAGAYWTTRDPAGRPAAPPDGSAFPTGALPG